MTGASSGIGRATALVMAAQGAKVVVAARREMESGQVVEEITSSGGTAAYVRTDVTEEDQVQAMVEFAVSEFGRLDCAVNNSGGGFRSDAGWPEASPEALRKTFDLNVFGVWLCMKHEIGAMLERGGGAIVNVSSIAGMRVTLGEAYTSSKYAVNGLTRSAAAQYGKQGVRVNSVAPGIIDAGSWKPRLEAEPDLRAKWNDAIPIGRVGRPEEVGEAIAWLCSDAASYITGAIIPIDGGNTMTINAP